MLKMTPRIYSSGLTIFTESMEQEQLIKQLKTELSYMPKTRKT